MGHAKYNIDFDAAKAFNENRSFSRTNTRVCVMRDLTHLSLHENVIAFKKKREGNDYN